MAEPIRYQILVSPFVNTISSTKKEGETNEEIVLSTAQLDTLNDLIASIKDGDLDATSQGSIDVILTAVLTADADYDSTKATAVKDFLDAIVAGTDVSSVITAINAL
jgi:hypothetical protein